MEIIKSESDFVIKHNEYSGSIMIECLNGLVVHYPECDINGLRLFISQLSVILNNSIVDANTLNNEK